MHKITNQSVADLFAEGYTEGESGNMFIEGNVVYSYGHHFPIAVRSGGKVYFNSDGYSMTTSIHKGRVLRALASRGVQVVMKNTEELNEIIRSGEHGS
jgi:hypothetical protein